MTSWSTEEWQWERKWDFPVNDNVNNEMTNNPILMVTHNNRLKKIYVHKSWHQTERSYLLFWKMVVFVTWISDTHSSCIVSRHH